jgi:DNA-binding NarL/FixJ family response regulator
LLGTLDRSRARVRTLVAGPGYGKTILLEQWAPRDGRVLGWYRARRSAADVAVVARGLQTAAESIVPGAGRRMLERLSVTDDPEREAVLLAEMLAEDLDDWPDEGWIVVDDYQHLSVSAACEAFVETIVSRSGARLLLASRVRPRWVEGREILYGDVLEVGQTMLAMTAEEAGEVLEGGRADLVTGLLSLAEGWPAVIGLAGMAPDVAEIDADLPETLYEFFADEIYRALDPRVASGLAVLAAMPIVDEELAVVLFGRERAELVCGEALALGILDDRDGRLELHPLAAAFLASRARRQPDSGIEPFARRALPELEKRREWDACFELVRTHGFDNEFRRICGLALDEMVFGGRLLGLEEWVEHAKYRDLTDLVFGVAEAQVHLRHGRHVRALTLARSLVDRSVNDRDIQYRAHIVAAQAAHIGSLEEEALRYYSSANAIAPDFAAGREAGWGEVMCLAALEREAAHSRLKELASSVNWSDARDQVRMVDKQLSVGFRFGFVRHLQDAHRIVELVPQISDPLLRCSFRSMYAWALLLGAFYSEALDQARLLILDAEEYRVDPALPYGHATAAAALAGLREFERASDHISTAASEARRVNDENGMQNAYAIRTRILLQQGQVAEACAIEPPDVGNALRSMRGEVLASRSLVLASIGRVDEANSLVETAVGATSGIETHQLAHAVRAVVSLKTRDPTLVNRCEELVREGFTSGAVDPAVTAYRSNPGLLSALLTIGPAAEKVVFLLRRAGDEGLVKSFGATSTDLVDPMSTLTRREREVYGLVCQGLTNPEIARLLFISEATVKIHVRHVFDKLGIRSRRALALDAATRNQAAPTVTSDDSMTSSV